MNQSREPSLSLASLIATQSQGIPLQNTIVTPQRLGSFYAIPLVAIAGAGTVVPHQLGRIPTGIIVLNSQAGTVVFGNAADQAAWTASTIKLRSSGADTIASILVG